MLFWAPSQCKRNTKTKFLECEEETIYNLIARINFVKHGSSYLIKFIINTKPSLVPMHIRGDPNTKFSFYL